MTSTLTLSSVGHDYGDGPVLRKVDLAVVGGQVHALLGMNGAGKSTLVHIAAGFFAPSQGAIAIDGVPVRLDGPGAAFQHGIALLAQEVDRGLVPDATVHENLTAGLLRREGTLGFSKRANRDRARAMLEQYAVDIDPDRQVDSLSLYEKQALSLVRAAATDARFLFLDEPTSAFDAAETERFYGIVDALKASGIGIVFISHRLPEVFRIADQVTVLRGGEVSLAAPIGDVTRETVVEAITGAAADIQRSDRPAIDRETVFSATGIDLGRGRAPFDLSIGAGEIVAAFGPLGAGKSALARTLFGLRGKVAATVAGKSVTIRTPERAAKLGLALVPEERRTQGLWLEESVQTHAALGFRGIIRRGRERAAAKEMIADYDVQPPRPEQLVRRLSGGNQQKVAVGKWAQGQGRRVLILDEPMKGVDVAAKEAIFRSIERLAASGIGVLYLTQEPDDALRIADRILVLGRSGLVLDRPAAAVTAVDLMFAERTDAA